MNRIPFKVVDIGAERQKPVFTGVQEFTDKIKGYSLHDYYNTEKPYWDLVETSRAQVGLFDQYAAAMLAQIRKLLKIPDQDKDTPQTPDQKYAREESILKHIADEIESYKYIHILGCNEANSIVRYIKEVEDNVDCVGLVSVLPLMCGAGKSTALTLLIKETIERIEKTDALRAVVAKKAAAEGGELNEEEFEKQFGYGYDGLIIVTDSIDRLKKIWKPDKDNKYISVKDRKFINKHSGNDWVTIMTGENSLITEREQLYTPVLCITTQRYFSWDREQIQEHLKWGAGEVKHRRPLVIFDEQPYLNEVRDISVKTINDIDTALREYLDEDTNKEEKLWCCDQWDAFRNRFFALLRHYEYDFNGFDTLFYQPEQHNITEDDERFFDIIRRSRKKICAKDNDAYMDLQAVRTFMNSWGIYNHRDANPTHERTPKGEYWNKFSVFIDNRDKVMDLEIKDDEMGNTDDILPIKVIVLDGTGNVSPIYKDLDYVHIHDGTSFLRSLSYLNIMLCDFPTSKQDFKQNGSEIAKAVKAYLLDARHKLKDVIFFTYKGKESKFQAKDENGNAIKNIAHLGDIKGKNDFSKKTNFAQVGLYRLQPVHYLVHVLGRNPELLQELAAREPESMYNRIQEIYESEEFLSFMYDHILTDVDQCMFRSAIRNSDNLQPVTYYLFYKQHNYPLLRSKIEQRYKSELGANITPVEEMTIWNIAKAGTNETIITIRIQEWKGEPIKLMEFLAKIPINPNSYYTVYRRSKEKGTNFAVMMDELRQNAMDMGYSSRWIAKKPVHI